jgi:AmmeMemoRadiSam system protein B
VSPPDEETNLEEKPRLRGDLRILPAQAGGARALVIQDPVGLMEKPMAVGGQALELFPLLDGRHSIIDLQTELTRRYGILITGDQVKKVLAQLDQAYLLESPRYREALGKLAADFRAQAVLPATHAGEAYPADADMIRNWADALLKAYSAPEEPEGEVLAVVAPHIDPRVGSEVYAAAYGPLRGADFDRVIILGVGHSLREGILCLTEKDVETPLGRLGNDRELVAELRAAAGDALAPDDFAFRGEHSVEFQAVLLQHVLANGEFPVVPVLCGSFDAQVEKYGRASEVPGAGKFIEVLARVLAERDSRTLVVAGVDLSHVGPKFGDELSSRAIAPDSEKHDRELLEALCALDAGRFWSAGRTAAGRFNVCGFGALACLLEALPPKSRVRQAGYHVWHEEPTQSSVSFAAAVISAGPEAG